MVVSVERVPNPLGHESVARTHEVALGLHVEALQLLQKVAQLLEGQLLLGQLRFPPLQLQPQLFLRQRTQPCWQEGEESLARVLYLPVPVFFHQNGKVDSRY